MPHNVHRAVFRSEYTTMFYNADVVNAMSDEQRLEMGIKKIDAGTSVSVHID